MRVVTNVTKEQLKLTCSKANYNKCNNEVVLAESCSMNEHVEKYCYCSCDQQNQSDGGHRLSCFKPI